LRGKPLRSGTRPQPGAGRRLAREIRDTLSRPPVRCEFGFLHHSHRSELALIGNGPSGRLGGPWSFSACSRGFRDDPPGGPRGDLRDEARRYPGRSGPPGAFPASLSLFLRDYRCLVPSMRGKERQGLTAVPSAKVRLPRGVGGGPGRTRRPSSRSSRFLPRPTVFRPSGRSAEAEGAATVGVQALPWAGVCAAPPAIEILLLDTRTPIWFGLSSLGFFDVNGPASGVRKKLGDG
jgi:hypothetical protein